jgi:hypothetical protein
MGLPNAARMSDTWPKGGFVDVNRALFLSLTASLFGGAAMCMSACGDDTSGGSSADAAPDGVAAADATEATEGGNGTNDATISDASVGDVAAEATVDATVGDASIDSPVDAAGDSAVEATADAAVHDSAVDATSDAAVTASAVEASADAPADQTAGDVEVAEGSSDAANSADVLDAGGLPPLLDGGVTENCAPFTCELGQANCLAAYGGGTNEAVAEALYACAQTVCSPDSGVSTFTAGTSCATAAFETTAPDGGVSSFCASSASCNVDAGGVLGVSECEEYLQRSR